MEITRAEWERWDAEVVATAKRWLQHFAIAAPATEQTGNVLYTVSPSDEDATTAPAARPFVSDQDLRTAFRPPPLPPRAPWLCGEQEIDYYNDVEGDTLETIWQKMAALGIARDSSDG